MFFRLSLSDHERDLYDGRIAELRSLGYSQGEAKQKATRLMKRAVQESKSTGRYTTGPIGRKILKKYRRETPDTWKALQHDGVTEQDVVKWWDLPDVDRWWLLLSFSDEWNEFLQKWISEGETPEEALSKTWRMCCRFGASVMGPVLADNDASVPLPVELVLRIVTWRNSLSPAEADAWGARSVFCATQNDYMRQLIRQGRI